MGRTDAEFETSSLYGFVAGAALSLALCTSVAGFGLGLGVEPGAELVDIVGGAFGYPYGQMEPMTPAEGVAEGAAVVPGRETTPISLLKRILRGSAFANIGACASAFIFHTVAAPEVSTVGFVAGGAGVGEGFSPYSLNVVTRLRAPAIQVLGAALPWRCE